MREQRRGLLARLFCFVPHARVGHFSRKSSINVKKQRNGEVIAADGQAPSASAPPSPASADVLATYLGSQPALQPPFCSAAKFYENSIVQTSTYSSCGSNSDSGSASWRESNAGYEADSEEEGERDGSPASGRRRFAPAVRHVRESSRGLPVDQPAVGGEEQGQGTIGGLANYFERPFISSCSHTPSSSGHDAGSSAVMAAVWDAPQAASRQAGDPAAAAPSAAKPKPPSTATISHPSPHAHSLPPSTSCTNLSAVTSVTPSTRCFGWLPSRDGSVLNVGDGSSSTASLSASSISLAHFLGTSSGSSSGKRKLCRLGSTQVVVSQPGSPGSGQAPCAAPGPAAAAATVAVQAALGKTASTAATVTADSKPQPAAAAMVQRRLTEIHSGHFITLDKLLHQCGDLAEPPSDLLSLMARRVFASRDAGRLQRLCDEGQLGDLQVEEEAQEAPSAAATAPFPGTPVVALCQEPPSPLLMLDRLPQLPPIRTRVVKRCPERAESTQGQ